MVCPVKAFHRLKIPVGRAADPDTISRMGECCITSEGFSVLGSVGATSSIFAYIVGTAINNVGSLCTSSMSLLMLASSLMPDKALFHLFDASASRSQILIGLNRTNSTLPPAQIAQPNKLITENGRRKGSTIDDELYQLPHNIIPTSVHMVKR